MCARVQENSKCYAAQLIFFLFSNVFDGHCLREIGNRKINQSLTSRNHPASMNWNGAKLFDDMINIYISTAYIPISLSLFIAQFVMAKHWPFLIFLNLVTLAKYHFHKLWSNTIPQIYELSTQQKRDFCVFFFINRRTRAIFVDGIHPCSYL